MVKPSAPKAIVAFDIHGTLDRQTPDGEVAIDWEAVRRLAGSTECGYRPAFVTGHSLQRVEQIVRAAPADVRTLLDRALVSAENGAAFARVDGNRLVDVRFDEALVVPIELRELLAAEVEKSKASGQIGRDVALDTSGPRAVASFGTTGDRPLGGGEQRVLYSLLHYAIAQFDVTAAIRGTGTDRVEVSRPYATSVDVRRVESDESGVVLKERGMIRLITEFVADVGVPPRRVIVAGDTVSPWGVAGSSDMATAVGARRCGVREVGFVYVGDERDSELARQWAEAAGIALALPLGAGAKPVGPTGVVRVMDDLAGLERQMAALATISAEPDATLALPEGYAPPALGPTVSVDELGLGSMPGRVA